MINEADLDFFQTVWNRRPTYTYIFFGFNILIFALMTLAGGAMNDETLIAFGVKANELIDQGEYWRFVTPVFIHIGLLHLFFNSYALWLVGPQVEKLYGGARFVALYLLTGVAGVLGSYWYHPDIPSAGASGAIFGLFGVLLIFGVRNRHSVPPHFQRSVGTSVLPVIVINLIIGFTIPQIDNSAHISGLIAGMALAAVIPFKRPGEDTPAVFQACKIALLAVVMLSFVQVARHYDGPRLALQNVSRGWTGLSGGRSTTREFIDALNSADRAFLNSIRALDENRSADALPVLGGAIDQLKAAPSLSSTSDEITSEMVSVMQNQYELLRDVERAGATTLMHNRQAAQNATKYRELQEALHQWVQSDGVRYGIQLPKPQ